MLVQCFLIINGLMFLTRLLMQLFVGRSEQNYEIVMNALPSVDTFFFMSGLLVAYLSFIEMEKKRFNLALFYLHRYIR